jgi:hypothetical protein
MAAQLEIGGIASLTRNISTSQLNISAALFQGKQSLVPLSCKLHETQELLSTL